MQDERVRQVLQMLSGKLPEEKLVMLRNKLVTVPDNRVDEILCVQLHNPTHILLFSIFLGGIGVDRFMIGDVGLGVAKLLFGWITFGLWPLIDIFICYKKAKENNFNKIMTLL
ncbi:MAG: TM2 domain-containing protein [Clostridia bacterium]|nr:TM2 domain-containing protein [Clostridia bacterium]